MHASYLTAVDTRSRCYRVSTVVVARAACSNYAGKVYIVFFHSPSSPARTQHGRAIQTVLPEVLHSSGTCEADLAAVSRRFSIRDVHMVFGVVVANPTSCGQTV